MWKWPTEDLWSKTFPSIQIQPKDPPPKPVRIPMQENSESSESTDINPEININFEENSPFQEGVISDVYQRPNKSFL